jgi:hypothetical protein
VNCELLIINDSQFTILYFTLPSKGATGANPLGQFGFESVRIAAQDFNLGASALDGLLVGLANAFADNSYLPGLFSFGHAKANGWRECQDIIAG